MSEKTESFLAHYGVRGMKWGVRKQARVSRREARAAYKLQRSGDSVKKAGWKIAGKEVANQVILSQGGAQLATLVGKNNPTVMAGVALVAGLTSMGISIKNINDAVDLHAHANRDK